MNPYLELGIVYVVTLVACWFWIEVLEHYGVLSLGRRASASKGDQSRSPSTGENEE